MSQWTILCDFDGTISVEDITDSLLERFGRDGWQAIEQAWKRGEIGSRECMARQVALIDASRDELDAHLDRMAIDPAFPAFVAAARAAGMPLAILSDGLDYAIERILGRCGIDDVPIIANRLVAEAARGWRLEFPYGRNGCLSGNCKCSSAGIAHADHRRVLMIGDGASDFCVAGEVDFVFAKHRLVEHCRAAGIAHATITGFADAVQWLPMLPAGEFAGYGADRSLALLHRVA